MRVIGLTALFALAAVVHSTSDGGVDIDDCNVQSKIYGCKIEDYDPSVIRTDEKACRDTTRSRIEMWWAIAPQRTNNYVLYAAAIPDMSKAINTYVPGKLNRIHIQTVAVERNFRGLMMNARNAAGEVVGDWEVPNESPAAYRHPEVKSGPGCKGTLLHANASPKTLSTTFLFRAPPAGTGPITIDALLKSGGANEGTFWWPKSELVLQERTAPVTGTWIRSNLGESCTEACARSGAGACNLPKLQEVADGAYLDVYARYEFPCQIPLVSQCAPGGLGATSSEDDECFFHNPALCTGARSGGAQAVTCEAKSNNKAIGFRLCPCGQVEVVNQRRKLTEVNQTTYTRGLSSAASSSSPALTLSGFLISLLLQPQRAHWAPVVALTLSMLAPSVNADNWINSLSRAKSAPSTRKPLPPRVDLQNPHVLVTPGQEFEVEWAIAHGRPSFFVLVKAADEPKLATMTMTDIQTYLNECTGANANFGNNLRFQKFNRRVSDNKPGFFTKQIATTDPDFSTRPTPLVDNARKTPRNNQNALNPFRYLPDRLKNDKRCAYRSAKFPYMLEVSTFEIVTMEATASTDVARFRVGRKAADAGTYVGQAIQPGNYVLYWLWSGFSDGVDITVIDPNTAGTVNGEVPNPYGTDGAVSSFRRVDHCEMRLGFKEPNGPKETEAKANATILNGKAFEVAENVDACIQMCNQNAACKGIQVGPLKSPAAVPDYLQRSLFPLKNRGSAQPMVDNTPFNGLTPEQMENTVACYASTGVDIDARVVDITRTTSDPQDPAFYGTCLEKVAGRNFGLNVNTASAAVASSFFVNSVGCVSCADRKLYDLYQTLIPDWTVSAGECVNCDIEPSAHALPTAKAAQVKNEMSFTAGDKTPLTAAALPWKQIAARNAKACDPAANTCGANGAADTNACVQTITLLGAAANDQTSPEECFRMAQRRGFSEVSYETGKCVVYAQKACCGTCKATVTSANLLSFTVPPMEKSRSSLVFQDDMLAQLTGEPEPGTPGAPGGPGDKATGDGASSNLPIIAGAAGAVVVVVGMLAYSRSKNNGAAVSAGRISGGKPAMTPYGGQGQMSYGQAQSYGQPQAYNPRRTPPQQQMMPSQGRQQQAYGGSGQRPGGSGQRGHSVW